MQATYTTDPYIDLYVNVNDVQRAFGPSCDDTLLA